MERSGVGRRELIQLNGTGLEPHYNTLINYEPPASTLPFNALTQRNDRARIQERWNAGGKDGIIVLDNFLTPVALERLRRWCWGSTMWYEVKRGAGAINNCSNS